MRNSLLAALEEPAFIFDPEGGFSFCNNAGREILSILGLNGVQKAINYDALVHTIKFTGLDYGGSCVALGGKRYRLVTGPCEEGTLLRLLPMQENDHILRLSSSLDILPWALVTVDRSEPAPVTVYYNKPLMQLLPPIFITKTGQAASDIFRAVGIEDDVERHMRSPVICHHDYEAKRGGRVYWYRLHFIPYAPQSPYCLMVVEDMTENKIMEGQYFQAQRLEALGQLAGGVAHDFNNILSIIDGYARIARKALAGVPEPLEYIERISQAVQRGAALTSQLLTFGRYKVMNEKVFDLGKLVEEQEPLLRPLMDASIRLSIQCDENIFVEATADHICQILMNLCINARDAMSNGGDLSISVSRVDDRHALIKIADTGCGMSPAIESKMFDPFFTTKDQGKGTGLGLSMVYGLVKAMKGEIGVITSEGSGTTFRILLPLANNEFSEIAEDEENGALQLCGMTALIAEDEPDLLNIVSGMVEEMGAHVIRARNGSEALALQDQFDGEIDFLLTDVVMPEMNGVKLAELFEVLHPSSQVLFMSGYPPTGQMARVSLPEGSNLVAKPVDFEKLSSVLKGMTAAQRNKIKTQWKINAGRWKTL